jgi:uroporphyrinogen decarboxylase
MMTHRENMIAAYRFQRPEWVPIGSGLPWVDWAAAGYEVDELEAICMKHTILFPGYEKGTLRKNHEAVFKTRPDLVAGNEYVDGWKCTWKTNLTGMVGAVIGHPLKDWSAFKGFQTPNPDKTDGMLPVNWEEMAKHRKAAAEGGWFFGGHLPHGHTFLRIQDMRGYENVVFDMADEEPLLDDLLKMLTDFNCEVVKRWLALNPDMIAIPEDLGMQTSPMLSPEHFHRYIAPAYERLTRPIKAAGVLVHEHSDGYIMPLMDDIIATGGDVINMQDLVNGIDDIAKHVKGRISIDLDIDRQKITVNGSPKDIDDHIRECVEKLSSPTGGLSLVYQPWAPTPAKNMDAVFTAMEKYCVTEYKR